MHGHHTISESLLLVLVLLHAVELIKRPQMSSCIQTWGKLHLNLRDEVPAQGMPGQQIVKKCFGEFCFISLDSYIPIL